MAQHYYYVLLSNDCVMSDLTDLSSQCVISKKSKCTLKRMCLSRRLETRVDRESNLVKHQTYNWKQF